MFYLNPTHLYESSAPAIYLGLILGTTPIIPINQGAYHQLVTNKCLCLTTFTYIIAYTALLIFGQRDLGELSRQHNVSRTASTTTAVIWLFMATATTYTIYISSIRNGDKIKNILESIVKTDVLLQQLGQKMHYKKDMWYEIFNLLSLQILQIVILSFQIWNAPREHLLVPTFKAGIMIFLPSIVQNLMETQFVLLTIIVYHRFQMVNQHLTSLGFHITEKQTSIVVQKLDMIMRIHDGLCDTSSLIDETYGGQMFISSLAQFILIVTTTFSFYINMKLAPIDSWILLGWGIMKTIELLRKVISCHITANEASSTKVEVHKLFLLDTEDLNYTRLMEFSQQLMHRKVEFTARGMFSLDATLLFTVVATVTTYMVILYQFNEGSQPICLMFGNTTTTT